MPILRSGGRSDSVLSTKTRAKSWLCLVFGLSLTGAAFLAACTANRDRHRGVDILSRTVITGSVNGSPFEGRVSATFNTRRGGSSSCEFDRLPAGFTPATINSHA